MREALGDGTDIIAGNVATPEGARDLAEAGADGVKVGVGPGSVCTTRVVAGVGVPQLSAVMRVRRGLRALRRAGHRRRRHPLRRATSPRPSPAGAETVMVGNLLAGTPESPGRRRLAQRHAREGLPRDGVERGRGGTARGRDGGEDEDATEFTPVVAEGVEAVVPLRDAVAVVCTPSWAACARA